MKHLLQIASYLIAVIVLICYWAFLSASGGEFSNYLTISNIINLFLVVLLFIKLKLKTILPRTSMLALPYGHFRLLLIRLSFLSRDARLLFFFITPVLFLFAENVDPNDRLLFCTSHFFQQLFTVLVFLTLLDFLTLKGFENHLRLVLPLLASLLIFARGTDLEEIVYLLNPLGIVNFPLYLYVQQIAGFFILFSIPLFAVTVYFINRFLLRNWI